MIRQLGDLTGNFEVQLRLEAEFRGASGRRARASLSAAGPNRLGLGDSVPVRHPASAIGITKGSSA